MLAREELLDAAIRVVSRDGLGAITLDAVAREAGVSKGGLTHHYATKDALISAMLEHFALRLLRELDRHAADDPEMIGRRIRAMIKVGFPGFPNEQAEDKASPKKLGSPVQETSNTASSHASSEVQQLFLTAITASVVNPQLLKPLGQQAAELRERMLNQSSDGLWQIVLWSALDGLLLWRLLGLLSGDDPLHFQLLRLLHDLSRDPPDVALKPDAVVQPVAAVEREVAHATS